MVIKAYIDANIVKLSTDSCISHGFVIKKPHIPPNMPRMKTLADLENPEIDAVVLGKVWRLIIDQKALNRGLQDFSSPNATVREIMNVFTTDRIFITMDLLNFFSQVTLSKASRWLTTFSAGYAEMAYCLVRAPQGGNSSCPGCSLILKLALYGLLREGFSFSYVDNIALSDFSFEGLFQTYKAILERSRYYNLVWKVSDIVIGYSCTEKFDVLGLTVESGRLKIPREKVESFSPDTYPRTKKSLVKLTGNMNYFSAMSPAIAELNYQLRQEIDQQTGKKFIFMNKMERILRAALELICNSQGLLILSKDQYIHCTMILFVDSSKTTWGCTLVAVINDQLWPIMAVSKSHTKAALSYCIKKREFLAAVNGSHEMRLIFQNRLHLICSDSAFTRYCLEKPAEEVSPKLRGAVLLYRENFFSRVLKVEGGQQLADLNSRYMIPSVASTGVTTEEDAKVFKWHMGVTKLSPDLVQTIEEQAAILNRTSLEDELVKTSQNEFPVPQ